MVLPRQTLRDRCKESGLTVRGNVDELKKKIVHHALSQLPWHKASILSFDCSVAGHAEMIFG